MSKSKNFDYIEISTNRHLYNFLTKRREYLADHDQVQFEYFIPKHPTAKRLPDEEALYCYVNKDEIHFATAQKADFGGRFVRQVAENFMKKMNIHSDEVTVKEDNNITSERIAIDTSFLGSMTRIRITFNQ